MKDLLAIYLKDLIVWDLIVLKVMFRVEIEAERNSIFITEEITSLGDW